MNSTYDEGIETSVLDMSWIASLEKKVSDTKFRDRNREPTIYRVPDILKSVDPQAYEPLLVSLGPYHRDKPHLQTMNQLKWKYLKFVLEKNPGVTLVDYLERIKKMETRARDAYSEEVMMSSNNFVEMMLLDGCFMMLIITWNTPKIFEESTLWTIGTLVQDIFMLENQLPFFLLETLYQSAFPQGGPFLNLALNFIQMHTSSNLELPSKKETFHHIIHLFHSCIDPTRNHGNGNQSSTFGFLRQYSKLVKTVLVSLPSKLCSALLSQVNKIFTVGDANPEEDPRVFALPWIPNATIFNESGIHFLRKKRAKSFLDITFRNGKLEIPQLQILDNTNSLLRNLIAYEQCSMDSNLHVTCYAQFMDCLIDTAADVEFLQQDEIIINGLGDSQVVATLFNKLFMLVVCDPRDFYLMDVVNAMTKHRNTRFNKWRARLNRDYFGNPWAIISLFGVLLLFALTVIQTIYAILSYVRSPN